MSREIVEAMKALAVEKGIAPDRLVHALEDALLSAYKKQPGAAKYARVAKADASLSAEEAPEVVRLGQGARAARRGDLERVLLADLGQEVGDALAQVERDAVRVVDEQAQRVTADDLREEHLDIGRRLRETCLDICLQSAHRSSFLTTKKRASARFQLHRPGTGPESCSGKIAPWVRPRPV